MRRLIPRLALLLASLAAITSLAATPALAGAYAVTWHWTMEEQDLGAGLEPCLPSENWGATLTITTSGKGHITETNGTSLFSGSQHGTFVLDPDDPALPTYTGMYRDNISYNFNAYGESFVLLTTIVGSGEDGSRLVSVARIKATVTRNGLVLEFIDTACGG